MSATAASLPALVEAIEDGDGAAEVASISGDGVPHPSKRPVTQPSTMP